MGPKAQAVVLHPEAPTTLARLEADPNPKSRSIVKRVRSLRPALRADRLHGEVVGKRAIPTALSSRLGVDNHYVEDMPNFWRLLYTVTKGGGDRFVVVLTILDQRAYGKWLPGRGR